MSTQVRGLIRARRQIVPTRAVKQVMLVRARAYGWNGKAYGKCIKFLKRISRERNIPVAQLVFPKRSARRT